MELVILSILSSVGITGLIFAIVLWKTVPQWVQGQIDSEIEKLRTSNQNSLNRFSKVHEKESEVLPKIYKKMIVTKSSITSFRIGYSRYTDVSKLDEGEFAAFLKLRDFNAFELNTLTSATKEKRTKELGDIESLRRRNSAERELNNFRFYYYVNKVYVQKSLQAKINEVVEIFNKTFVDADIEMSHPSARERNTGFEKLDGLVEEIEMKMQERIRLNEA